MKQIINEYDNIYKRIYELRNLIVLLEDYFYDYKLDKETYEKNQSLCTAIKEKVMLLEDEMDNSFERIRNVEKGEKNEYRN